MPLQACVKLWARARKDSNCAALWGRPVHQPANSRTKNNASSWHSPQPVSPDTLFSWHKKICQSNYGCGKTLIFSTQIHCSSRPSIALTTKVLRKTIKTIPSLQESEHRSHHIWSSRAEVVWVWTVQHDCIQYYEHILVTLKHRGNPLFTRLFAKDYLPSNIHSSSEAAFENKSAYIVRLDRYVFWIQMLLRALK